MNGQVAGAGRMADGTSGSARLLRAEDAFPATARGPVDAFADRLDELPDVVRSAAKASTAEEFEQLLAGVGRKDGAREERDVRGALGLVLPGGGDLTG